MINTYLSYQLVTRDLNKSLARVESEPIVKRDTEYYLENIGKVKTAEEFVNDYRLFNYAMKAHGLEDMAYAKAFMLKALKEGVSEPDAFANKLTDKRYAEFVRSFNFAAFGENATTFNLANHGTTDRYLTRATPDGGVPGEAYVKEAQYYAANIGSITSIDQFLDNDRMLTFALQAFGLEASLSDKKLIRQMLEGGTSDPKSPANSHTNENWAQFAKSFDFAGLGESATTYNLALRPAVDKFVRQQLEQNKGQENEGVRLALYFERTAGTITNAYQLLGDRALATVIRTYLGLPDAIAQMDIDKQAAMLESRINFEDFRDPEKVSKMMERFATMWEVNNPTQSAQSSIVGLFQPMEFGISVNTLMAIAAIKR
ncbi:DUF1217 domain-containing protein [Mesorhizobium sp. CAU 1732]|uniref:DUF1217 domain-containing protein n=1 Tax=Mesorhizobium sp. CAU 1732 TaxID=3140358 RepID=UPI00326058F2